MVQFKENEVISVKRTSYQKLKYALEFTRIYKAHTNKYLRESYCVKFQMENLLWDIDEGDMFAGKLKHEFLGFSPQLGGTYLYFFDEIAFAKAQAEAKDEIDATMNSDLYAFHEFWKLENTCKKVNNRFINKFGYQIAPTYCCPTISTADPRVAGTNVDFKKLMTLGLSGLYCEIEKYKKINDNDDFYDAMALSLDTIKECCEKYAKQAEGMDNKELAIALSNIQTNKPQNLFEGIQLMWMYAVVSDQVNFGRMDEYLGDLYANSNISYEEAVEQIIGLYKQFKFVNKYHDTRVIIGGKGRTNPENSDKLAMVIMEASRRFKEVVPQLTLRYYKGMNEEVLDKALKVVGEGCTYPIIYSDDTNIPAVMKLMNIPYEEAEQYIPYGCGEYVLDTYSVGTPNSCVNLLKALEVVLYEGYDFQQDVKISNTSVSIDTLDTFEKLFEAYSNELKIPVLHSAWHKKFNYEIAGEESAMLLTSALMHDCIEKGKALLEGGVRYENACSEIYGIISCSDSLTAIKKLVYEDKLFTLRELAKMLAANFEGYEKERKMLQNAPKYGNDDEYADEIAKRVLDNIADLTISAGEAVGLNRCDICSVNNQMSATWGYFCAASACGRKATEAISNGNSSSIGHDKNGITSLLNSMAKFDQSKHAGVINNIRLSKEMFDSSFDKVKFLITTFLDNNGTQLNICVVGKDDLENAMKNPEEYTNLIIRVGGFSARFIELDSILQKELIERTTY